MPPPQLHLRTTGCCLRSASDGVEAGAVTPRCPIRRVRLRRPWCHRSSNVPCDAREDFAGVDRVLVLRHALQHVTDYLLAHEVGLESEFDQTTILGIVIVLLEFLAGIRDVLDAHLQIQAPSSVTYTLGQ